MARTAAKLEKELARLAELGDRAAAERDELLQQRAALSPQMVAAMASDSLSAVDEIERAAQAVDSKLTAVARRLDAISTAISLTREEYEGVLRGDNAKATRRRFDVGEQRFDAGQREVFDGIKMISSGLGEMRSGYREASQAADELVDLGEERPALYAFDPVWSAAAIQRLRDEAVTAALVAAQAASPDFSLDIRIGAAVPTAA